MIKDGTRLYINITNKCNTNCPFCCMYSGTNKNTFMDFETYKNIIDSTDDKFELQLEGGEPLLHPSMYLMIEYAIATGRCSKILVLTNGILLEKHLKRLVDISNWYSILIELKVSINYWLIQENKDFIQKLSYMSFATKHLPYLNIIFNVRKRKSADEGIEQLLEKYKIRDHSNVYYLQSYGKLTGSDYSAPVIVQNIQNWRVYASDGKCFETDLIARSEHEKELS